MTEPRSPARPDNAAAEKHQEGERLAKRVAATVGCSRAEAERYIAGACVLVDGQVCEDPATRVQPGQDVRLAPGATLEAVEPVTILLHKPAGIAADAAIATLLRADSRWEGDRARQRVLRRDLQRHELATPLDDRASGLVVCTQDWRVLRMFREEPARFEHEYVAELAGAMSDATVAALAGAGAAKRGGIGPHISRQSEQRLRIAGKGINDAELADRLARQGLQVRELRRLRIGRIALASLPAGRWRFAGPHERF
jgi:23S rRNA pseudouridine2604 synthase